MASETLERIVGRSLNDVAAEFNQEGCALIPGVLSCDEVAELRELTDFYASDPIVGPRNAAFVGDTFVLRYCHELDPLFQSQTTRCSVLEIASAVLGEDPRFNAMNVIRNESGRAISRWRSRFW